MFSEQNSWGSTGEKTGFIFSFIIFSLTAYFFLGFFNRLPAEWNFFHVILIVFCIILTGTIIKRLLK